MNYFNIMRSLTARSNEATLRPFLITDNGCLMDKSSDFILISPWVQELGQFGKKHICVRRTDGLPCCVQIAIKSQYLGFRTNDTDAEKHLMNKLCHPNLVRLYDLHEGADKIMLVTELCCGGDLPAGLFECSRRKGGLNESLLASVLKQILSAVDYMHSFNISHGDLKPANIHFSRVEEPTVQIKVFDFGRVANEPKWKRYLNREFGIVNFMAPEVASGGTNVKSDVWSVGAIMHAIFAGTSPFEIESDERQRISKLSTTVIKKFNRPEINRSIIERIKNGFQGLSEGLRISSVAEDLLQRLLTKNVAARPTAREALSHSWFDKASSAEISPEALEQFARKSAMDNFMAAVVSEFNEIVDISKIALLWDYVLRKGCSEESCIAVSDFEKGVDRFCPEVRVRDVREYTGVNDDACVVFNEFRCLLAYEHLTSICYRQKQVFDTFEMEISDCLSSVDILKAQQAIVGDPLIKRLQVSKEGIVRSLSTDQMSLNDLLLKTHLELFKAQLNKSFKPELSILEPTVEVRNLPVKKVIRRANSISFKPKMSILEPGVEVGNKTVKKVIRRAKSIGVDSCSLWKTMFANVGNM